MYWSTVMSQINYFIMGIKRILKVFLTFSKKLLPNYLKIRHISYTIIVITQRFLLMAQRQNNQISKRSG